MDRALEDKIRQRLKEAGVAGYFSPTDRCDDSFLLDGWYSVQDLEAILAVMREIVPLDVPMTASEVLARQAAGPDPAMIIEPLIDRTLEILMQVEQPRHLR